jgi:hypothetical protein
MLLETKVELKLVKAEITIPWIQLQANKAKARVKPHVALSFQTCPSLSYAIWLCELPIGDISI